MKFKLRRMLTITFVLVVTLLTLNLIDLNRNHPHFLYPQYDLGDLAQSRRHHVGAFPLPPAAMLPYFRWRGKNSKSISRSLPAVWPSGLEETDDRIMAQMAYVPPKIKVQNRTNKVKVSKGKTNKVILLYNGRGRTPAGDRKFHEDECPVRTCEITADKRIGARADAVVWQQSISLPPWEKPRRQVWVMYMLESPHHTPSLKAFRGLINWTATYRRDSTLVTPYERFQPYGAAAAAVGAPPAQQQPPPPPLKVNYARNKTKKVAWFVSNCGARNGRGNYVSELQKYIPVDVYGGCGPLKCPRHDKKERCFRMLQRDYKFYLAFENSNCKDYITEKLFWNAFSYDVVPVVMGARPIDYQRACPPHSYIHVDDFSSPRELAAYLNELDRDHRKYNEYFRWKSTGSFINTKFWCRLCAMLHDETRTTWYNDVDDWWRGGDTCQGRKGKAGWATWRNGSQLNRKSQAHRPEQLRYGPWAAVEGASGLETVNSNTTKVVRPRGSHINKVLEDTEDMLENI